nr:hypothetical protein Iba_chr06bCG13750 [Ipomoea batatas]
MREIDPKCELPTKTINPPKDDPLPLNKSLPKHNYEPHFYPNSHLNICYPPPPQFHRGYHVIHFQETLSPTPYFNHDHPSTRLPSDKFSPDNDDIKVLKEKVEMLIQVAKEDTTTLRAELRREMKEYLTDLRKEGFPLDVIETKMLAMTEELMNQILPRRGCNTMDDCPMLGVELESVVWEDDEPERESENVDGEDEEMFEIEEKNVVLTKKFNSIDTCPGESSDISGGKDEACDLTIVQMFILDEETFRGGLGIEEGRKMHTIFGKLGNVCINVVY